jgi:hypothetical protein
MYNELVLNTPRSQMNSNPFATPRQPNKFALFVKENFKKVKDGQRFATQGEIMKELSKMFKELNPK